MCVCVCVCVCVYEWVCFRASPLHCCELFLHYDWIIEWISHILKTLLCYRHSGSFFLHLHFFKFFYLSHTQLYREYITSSEMYSLHLTHPKWTHTRSSGQPCYSAQGAVGGSVLCSKTPQSWYWRRILPAPTIPARPEIRTYNLPLTSPTRYPLGHDCPVIGVCVSVCVCVCVWVDASISYFFQHCGRFVDCTKMFLLICHSFPMVGHFWLKSTSVTIFFLRPLSLLESIPHFFCVFTLKMPQKSPSFVPFRWNCDFLKFKTENFPVKSDQITASSEEG